MKELTLDEKRKFARSAKSKLTQSAVNMMNMYRLVDIDSEHGHPDYWLEKLYSAYVSAAHSKEMLDIILTNLGIDKDRL